LQAGTQLFTTTGGAPLDPSTDVSDPNIDNVDSSNFASSLADGSFSTRFLLNDVGGYSVYVTFTPTPEPEVFRPSRRRDWGWQAVQTIKRH